MEIGMRPAGIDSKTAYTEGAPTHSDVAARSEQPIPALEKALSKEQLGKELEGINKWLQTTSTHLKFTLHEELNEYYVQVINDETQEVIREIPSKKVMDMVAKFHEMLGLLIDEKR